MFSFGFYDLTDHTPDIEEDVERLVRFAEQTAVYELPGDIPMFDRSIFEASSHDNTSFYTTLTR